jgi:hypothetical protein
MPLQSLNDAKHWRDRAASMRVLSDQIKDPEAQEMTISSPTEPSIARHDTRRDASREQKTPNGANQELDSSGCLAMFTANRVSGSCALLNIWRSS